MSVKSCVNMLHINEDIYGVHCDSYNTCHIDLFFSY